MEITIVGLGLRRAQLTLEAAQVLESGEAIVLRTRQCDAAAWLEAKGIAFESLDALYDEAQDFDQLTGALAARVIERAERGPVVYGVLDLRDESVGAIARQAKQAEVRMVPGVPVDGVLTALEMGPTMTLAAADWEQVQFEASVSTLVREIASRELAGDIKLKLMERYPEEQPIVLWSKEGRRVIALDELDRLPAYDHTVSAYIASERNLKALTRYGFYELGRVVHILRAPGGCPWDRAQTHQSLRTNLIEEAWEVVDAIDEGDMDALYDELGDLLMQVVIHAEIAREHGEFSIDDVTSAIAAKLIARHRHVFGGERAETADDVVDLWEQVKREERDIHSTEESMRRVTKALPALMRAEKVLKKAGDDCAMLGPLDAGDLAAADDKERQIGRMLLGVVAQARGVDVKPELALGRAIDDFIDEYAQSQRKSPDFM